jgi:hypothetical protein
MKVTTARRRSGRRSPLGVMLILLAALAAGCAGPGAGPSSGARERLQLPSLDPGRILSETVTTESREIVQIERGLEQEQRLSGRVDPLQTCAAYLRLAWLRLQIDDLGGAHRALDVAAGQQVATPDAAALADLIRARVLAAEGSWSAAHRSLAEALSVERCSPAMQRYLDKAEIDFRPPEAQAASAGARIPALPALSSGPIELVRRSRWGSGSARPERMNPMGKPTRMTIHHTAMHGPATSSASISQIRAIQRGHKGDKGWGDIGYHFLIDRRGVIYEGRPLRYQGAHAGDGRSNAHNIGICLLGNYHDQRVGSIRPQVPTERQIASLMKLTRNLMERYAIPVRGVLTHREVHPKGPGATECPGETLQSIVESMRRVLARG